MNRSQLPWPAVAALFGAALLISGCDPTSLATTDASCNGRIGFSPCQDQGGAADAGTAGRLAPDAPESGAASLPCAAQYGFEDGTVQGFQISSCCGMQAGSVANSTERPWCGRRSLKVTFITDGGLSLDGPTVHTMLPQAVDLSGRTLVAHVYVDAPTGARLYGVLTVSGGLASLVPTRVAGLPAGRWSELTASFSSAIPAPATSIGVQVVGADFNGPVAVYLDEIGW